MGNCFPNSRIAVLVWVVKMNKTQDDRVIELETAILGVIRVLQNHIAQGTPIDPSILTKLRNVYTNNKKEIRRCGSCGSE